MDEAAGRRRYQELRESLPELFANPSGAAFEILTEPADVAAAEQAAAQRLAAAGQPESWAHTGVVFEDQYGLVVRDAVRLPGGSLGTYIRELAPDNTSGVVVLPVLAGDVVLVRHFRHATRAWHLEVPRGFGTPGRPSEEDARNELLEEIGATATRLVSLGAIYPDSGFSATPVQLFFAEINELGAVEAGEGISEPRLVSPKVLGDLIGSGEVDDGFTINSYTRSVLRGLLPPPW